MRPRLSPSSSSSSDYLMSDCSSSSSASSLDEDEINTRVYPCWQEYRSLILRRGYRLDTFRDVKEFYEQYWEGRRVDSLDALKCKEGYVRACTGSGGNEDALCRDAGLPDNLFRGTRVCDGKKVMVKAVHLRSREFDVIRVLSSPELRKDPRNHTIPVLDLIEAPERGLGFIVQEEWCSGLNSSTPSCLRGLLRALRQCIEGLVFMHEHGIAHLDISLGNVLTDFEGHYKYIDFETSRRYDCNARPPRISGCRGTEIPPDVECGGESCPFKVDVFALGVLILRACKRTGYDIPEILELTGPMLHRSHEARPTARAVLHAFDRIEARIASRLRISLH